MADKRFPKVENMKNKLQNLWILYRVIDEFAVCRQNQNIIYNHLTCSRIDIYYKSFNTKKDVKNGSRRRPRFYCVTRYGWMSSRFKGVLEICMINDCIWKKKTILSGFRLGVLSNYFISRFYSFLNWITAKSID